MKKFLELYNDIMSKYKKGEFGSENLTLGEILDRAEKTDLFNQMSLSEIQNLSDSSSGMTKQMYQSLYNRRLATIEKTKELENELKSYNIGQFCDGENISCKKLAEKLKLDVQYCKKSELPEDVEAMLSSSDNKQYFGVIKILKSRKPKFQFMHEIIHYFKDVGLGKSVQKEYSRKIKGKTDSDKEQEVNYLTAAAVMPIKKIALDIDEYENTTSENETEFLTRKAEEYGQDIDAVSRRFIEVRSLLDYGYNI